MPRPDRLNIPGIPKHITQRGNNRQACFYTDEDHLLYMKLPANACRAYDCSLHACVLMTSHVHLLLIPWTSAGASLVMHDAGRDLVRAINKPHRRTGTLREGRFKTSPVELPLQCLGQT